MKSMKVSVDVELQNPYEYTSIPKASDCQLWVETALSKIEYDTPCTMVIRFVDEAEGRTLNHSYRNKNSATNVLSFPYEVSEFELDIPELANNHIGDLVLCEELVIREAKVQNKEILQHWAHLIIHGTLHLNGYDHLNDDEAETMEALEITILKKLGYQNPYKVTS
jgi:probable rRNA maturation factor